MRLTDFIASLMSIRNYQKLLINKSRKYQIRQLRNPDTLKGQSVIPDMTDDTEKLNVDVGTELNAEFFEAKYLTEEERTVEWLINQIRL